MNRRGRVAWIVAALVALAAGAFVYLELVRPAQAGRRLLVVGWDGATFRMIDPMLREGRLPHLAQLIDRGCTARLESIAPPNDAGAWVSAFTGQTPGRTGVLSFFEEIPQSYSLRLVEAGANAAEPVWRTLGDAGRASLVFGVPMTYPPETIRGVMVSGMPAPPDGEIATPPNVGALLRTRGFMPDLGSWRVEQEVSGELVEKQEVIKRDVLVQLLEQEPWDFALIDFRSLDVVSHFQFDGRTDGPVGALYQALDSVLGDLMAAAGPDVDVMVVSDHGFEAYAQGFFPFAWLLEQGLAASKSPGLMPDIGRGPIAERVPMERDAYIDTLDLARTRVLIESADGNFGTLRINLEGREPQGIVAPEEKDALLGEVAARLAKLVVPDTRAPLVKHVWKISELYPGPLDPRLPDLVFETDPAVGVRIVPSDISISVLPRPQPDHDRFGVLIAAGPSFASARRRESASILDLAPTALRVLGVPIPERMQGAPLERFLADAASPAR